MRLLLDTHTFIWYATDNSRLSAIARLGASARYNSANLGLDLIKYKF